MANETVTTDEIVCLINEELRVISVPTGLVLGVEGDANVNRIRFRMKRMYRGTDLSTFTYARINYANANNDKNYYEAKDFTADEEDCVTFTWLLTPDVTAYKGSTYFVIHLLRVEDNVVKQSFHTSPASGKVLNGLSVSDPADPEEVVDYLTNLKSDLYEYAETLKESFTNGGNGLTKTEKNYILSLFAASTYTSSRANALYKALQALWSGDSSIIPVQSISLSSENVKLAKGDAVTIAVTIVPANATNRIVSWSVSPSGYATISDTGEIAAIASGTCIVTATVDGKTASCTVVVTERQTIPGETPVYELPAAKQFIPSNTEYIDTGIKVFEDISAHPNWTLLIDANDFGRLTNLSVSPVMFHCGAKESDGFMSIMAWLNGAIVFNLYGVENRLGWWGGSTTAHLNTYLQIKDTQYRMGYDPENDTWKDIPDYGKNIDASLILGAWRGDDGTISRYWDGTLNKFIVYDKVLTNEQIRTFLKEE